MVVLVNDTITLPSTLLWWMLTGLIVEFVVIVVIMICHLMMLGDERERSRRQRP